MIARPATFAYRAGKFVRRNKLVVAYLVDLYEAWGEPQEAERYRALLPEPHQDGRP